MRTYSYSLLSNMDIACKLTVWSHRPLSALFQESCGMLQRSPLGWHGWWQASLQPQNFPFYGCLLCRKRIRSDSTVSPGKGSQLVPRKHRPSQRTVKGKTDKEVSLAHLQPVPFSKKVASSPGGLVPNLNSLQLHLKENISDRRAVGQRHQSNLVTKPVW